MKKNTDNTENGKDEMNIIEYPISLLAVKRDKNIKTIECIDTIMGPDGPVIREWCVTGTDKYGLPLSQDNDVLLALLSLGKENNFKHSAIYFTRYKLCQIMDWQLGGANYRRIEESLQRLSGVRIDAKNAFYDVAKKTYVTINIGIIDSYFLYDKHQKSTGEACPLNFVMLNSIFLKSLQSGYIKSLDMKTYYGFESAVTKRLYRYLDKKRYDGKKRFEINLYNLAYNRIGLNKDTYKEASRIKDRLNVAHAELIHNGFIAGAEYRKTADGSSEKVIYAFTDCRQKEVPALPAPSAAPSAPSVIDMLSPEELPKFRQRAEELARQEGGELFKGREVPEQVINGYIKQILRAAVK